MGRARTAFASLTAGQRWTAALALALGAAILAFGMPGDGAPLSSASAFALPPDTAPASAAPSGTTPAAVDSADSAPIPAPFVDLSVPFTAEVVPAPAPAEPAPESPAPAPPPPAGPSPLCVAPYPATLTGVAPIDAVLCAVFAATPPVTVP